jgi:hypothetical protein
MVTRTPLITRLEELVGVLVRSVLTRLLPGDDGDQVEGDLVGDDDADQPGREADYSFDRGMARLPDRPEQQPPTGHGR